MPPATTEKFVRAYASTLSVAPGETLRIHAAVVDREGNPFGPYSATLRLEQPPGHAILTAPGTLARNGIPADAAEAGFGWPASFEIEIARDAQSGVYAAVVAAAAGDVKPDRVFVAVRAPLGAAEARILVMKPDLRDAAYNLAGGASLYGAAADPWNPRKRARKVSLLRPLAIGEEQSGTGVHTFVEWMRKKGFTADACSDVDIHDYDFLRRYQLLLSVGHHEYWTKEMRDNVERFVEDGGNVAFLSGNTCYWQVRLEADGNTVVCYKSAAEDPIAAIDPSRATVRWFHPPVSRPANLMMGAGGQVGGWNVPPKSRYLAAQTFWDHWAFGAVRERTDFGDGYHEVDGADTEFVDGRLVLTGRDGTPPSFVILSWRDFPQANQKPAKATLGVMRRGGMVFTTGNVNWTGAALDETSPTTAAITQTVIERLQFAVRPEWEACGALRGAGRPACLAAAFADLTGAIPTTPMLYAVAGDQLVMRPADGQFTPWTPCLPTGVEPTDFAAIAGGSVEAGFDPSKSNRLLIQDRKSGKLFLIGKEPSTEVGQLDGACDAIAFSNFSDLWNGNTYVALRDGMLFTSETGTNWLPAATPAGKAVKTVAMFYTDVFAVTKDNELYCHTLGSAEPAKWSWTLLGPADVDVLAATSSRLFGYRYDNSLLYTRDCTRDRRPCLALHYGTSGDLRIEELQAPGKGTANALLQKGWRKASFADAFELGGVAHLFTYGATQRGAIDVVNARARSVGTKGTMSGWDSDWRQLCTFAKDGAPHILVTKTGSMKIEKVKPDGSGTDNVLTWTRWGDNWTAIRAFNAGGAQYFVAYDRKQGWITVERWRSDNTMEIAVPTMNFAKDCSDPQCFVIGRQPYLAGHYGDGNLAMHKIDLGGKTIQPVLATPWAIRPTHLRTLSIDGQLHLIGYDDRSGDVQIDILTADRDRKPLLRNVFVAKKRLPTGATSLMTLEA